MHETDDATAKKAEMSKEMDVHDPTDSSVAAKTGALFILLLFAYDTVGSANVFAVFVVAESGEIVGNGENGELDHNRAQTTNEELFSTLFQRLSLQEGGGPSPLEERRFDKARGDVASDSENGAETGRKRTTTDTEHYQLTQYAGSVRLMSTVNFSEFLKR